MFETEAEDSFNCKKVLYKWETDKRSYIDGFKDGAEFGYNKAFVEADKNLEESIEFDDKYTNAKIRGLDKTAYFESHGSNDTELCKKCIHGDNKGGCITRNEYPFNSFGCIKNNQFEPYEE